MLHGRTTPGSSTQALILMLVILGLGTGLHLWRKSRDTVWYGQLRPEDTGQPWARQDTRQLRLHRGHRAWHLPFTPRRSADHFEARWASCLRLERPTEFSLQLSFLGQARLRLDGADLIDAFDLPGGDPRSPLARPERAPRSRGKLLKLEAGTHLIQVFFRGRADRAWLALDASFDNQPPGPMPEGALELPRTRSQPRCRN